MRHKPAIYAVAQFINLNNDGKTFQNAAITLRNKKCAKCGEPSKFD